MPCSEQTAAQSAPATVDHCDHGHLTCPLANETCLLCVAFERSSCRRSSPSGADVMETWRCQSLAQRRGVWGSRSVVRECTIRQGHRRASHRPHASVRESASEARRLGAYVPVECVEDEAEATGLRQPTACEIHSCLCISRAASLGAKGNVP
jgi:hypothetical protein